MISPLSGSALRVSNLFVRVEFGRAFLYAVDVFVFSVRACEHGEDLTLSGVRCRLGE